MAASKLNVQETGAGIRTKFNANADLIDANTAAVANREILGTAQTLIDALKGGNTTDTINSLRTMINSLQTTTGTHTSQISTIMALLNSDDINLDTIQEIVDYIKDNRESIDEVLTDKLNVSTFNTFVSSNTTALNNKVDKDGAKVLSDVNFSTAKDSKLNGIAAGATQNDTDANLKNRANHTGTQAPSTIATNSTNRFVTDTNIANWNAKPDTAALANFISNSSDTFDDKCLQIVTLSVDQYDALESKAATTLYFQFEVSG